MVSLENYIQIMLQDFIKIFDLERKQRNFINYNNNINDKGN